LAFASRSGSPPTRSAVGGRGTDIRRGRPRYAPGRRLGVEEQDRRYRPKPFLWGLLSILGGHRCSGLARALEVSRPATKVRQRPVQHRGPVGLAWLDCWLRERSEAHGREPERYHDSRPRFASAGTGNVAVAIRRLGPVRPHCRGSACLSWPGRDCRRVVLLPKFAVQASILRGRRLSRVEARDAAVA
jgi:hypothetical protein